NGHDLLNTMSSSATTYVSSTDYTPIWQMQDQNYPVNGATLIRGFTWDPSTLRLSGTTTAFSTASLWFQDDLYSYDHAGNVTAIDHVILPGSVEQRECFGYDSANRLLTAFTTSKSACSSGADTSGLNPYNLAYSYKPAGAISTSTNNEP